MHIGEYVIIEQNSIICASKIGNYVHIGKNCIVVRKLYFLIVFILLFINQSHRCMINDNVKILDDSFITPDTVIPPFCVYGGKPGYL